MKNVFTLVTLSIVYVSSMVAADSIAPALYLDPAQPIEKCIDDLIAHHALHEKGAMLSTTAPAIDRLQIPVFNGWN